MSENLQAMLTVLGSQLVLQCPVFLALLVGAIVGIAAFVRGNRLAGVLAFVGFAALAVLLALQLAFGALISLWPIMMREQGLVVEEALRQTQALGVGSSCVFGVLKAGGLLAVVGALAAYAFRRPG